MPSNLPTDPPDASTPLRRFLARVLVELKASRKSPIPPGFFRCCAWPFAHGRLRRFLVRTAFVLACLATLVVAFFVVEKNRGRAAWRAYEAEAKARGVKLTLAEFVPPPVPDAENFAAIPIFEEAFRAHAGNGQPQNPFKLPQWKKGNRPPFDSLPKQQRTNLAAWQKLFVEAKVIPEAGSNAAADVLAALRKYEAPLAQLREAGSRPRSRFPVHWEDGLGMFLPHSELVIDAARLHALRTSTHLALNQREEALQDLRDGLRLYTALAEEPTLLAGLVRMSVLAMQENAVWGGLAGGQWGEAELRAIEVALAPLRQVADYQFAMASERAFCNQIYATIQSQKSDLSRLIGGMDSQPSIATAYASLYPRGWFYRSQVRSNQCFDEMLARVTVDPPRLDLSRPVSTFDEPVSKYERVRHQLFYLLTPALKAMEHSFAYAQTLTDQTRLACALERHRLARGTFPETLDVLSPEFIPSVPHDVITGAPLHYRLLDGGKHFALYSVGMNGKDDGGETGGKTSARDQADWVWHSAAK